jgi:hypothetical protein
MTEHGKLVNKNSGVEIPAKVHKIYSGSIWAAIDGGEHLNAFLSSDGWEWVPDFEPFKDGDVLASKINGYSYHRMYGRWFWVEIALDLFDEEAEDMLRNDPYYRTTAAEYFGGNQS